MGRALQIAALLLSSCANEAFKLHSLGDRVLDKSLFTDAKTASKNFKKKVKTTDEIMSSMTMSDAFGVFKGMNHSSNDKHLVSLVDRAMTKKQTPGTQGTLTREAVDRGRDLLNNIMDATAEKAEIEAVECDRFEREQLTLLLELEQDIAYVNSEAAGARAEILRSSEVIQVNEEIKIPTTQEQLRQHNEQCDRELRALRIQLYIVKNDTEVMKRILGMLCAETGQQQQQLLLQVDEHHGSNAIVQCRSCVTGHRHAWLRQERLRPLMAQLQSDKARQYIRDNLLAEFDAAPSRQPIALTQVEHKEVKAVLPDFEEQGMEGLEDVSYEDMLESRESCDELLKGINGSNYRGCQAQTRGGEPCKRWARLNESHPFRPNRYPSEGLEENYCRNPEGLQETIFCYTSQSEWDYCDPLPLVDSPEAATKHVCQPGPCEITPGNCTKLRDRFMVILAGFIDQRNKLQDDIEHLEFKCHETRVTYEYAISAAQTQITEEQVLLSEATKTMTESMQQSQLANEQHAVLNFEYTQKMETCCANKNMFNGEICALKKIRGELYRMENMEPGITDCEQTDWIDDECSVTCGGGTQRRTRQRMMAPVNGTACLPREMQVSCNSQGCPIDCEVGDWSEWSECTALCGGGVRQRSRPRTQEPDNDGEPCPEQSETQPCHVDACNIDCVLHDWSEWSLCSKACEGGHETRVRKIAEEVKGQGSCPHPEAEERMQFKRCNNFDCQRLIENRTRWTLQCASMLDVILLVDGSASLGWYGWTMVKRATISIIRSFEGEGSTVNVGLMTYGGPRTAADLEACTSDESEESPNIETQCGIFWRTKLTRDPFAAEHAAYMMEWPDSTTLTSMALLEAKAELINGRPDASSVVIVITDGQPMSPIRTGIASLALKEEARLIWIPVGLDNTDNFHEWASQPSQDNVIEVSTFAAMNTDFSINDFIASICPMVN